MGNMYRKYVICYIAYGFGEWGLKLFMFGDDVKHIEVWSTSTWNI